MKTILITGGLGYIGTNIKERYGDQFTFFTSDYGDYVTPVEEYNNLRGIDAVIHLAALSGIGACEVDPIKAIKDNILSANHIFKLAQRYSVPVIFTSSQAAKTPKSSEYAFMKWTCENLAHMYNFEGGNNYIVRLANVYGGIGYFRKKNTFIKKLITNYKNDVPIEVHGDGNQIRDFVHVYDVCDAFMSILQKRDMYKGPYDIGTGIGHSIIDVVKMLPNAKYIHNVNRSSGTDSSIADVSVAKEILGFEAKLKLEDYIKENIK